MRKLFLALLLCIMTGVSAFAQKGDLFAGATGGWITKYKAPLYGLNVAYHLSDPLEISFTGLMNPFFKSDYKGTNTESDVKLYSASVDLRFYLLFQRTWAMGPIVGGQYMYRYTDTNEVGEVSPIYTDTGLGFNIGWHMRFNITENAKVTGGWRYTSAGTDMSHNYYYLGLGYTFQLN